MTGRNKIILAPHPDDELINCYLPLLRGEVDEVWYFAECEERITGIARVAKKFNIGFRRFELISAAMGLAGPDFLKAKDTLKEIADKRYTFLVPHKSDYHPLHHQVNAFAKSFLPYKLLNFYSTDRNVNSHRDQWTILGKEDREKKVDLLEWCYPGQRALWRTNDKYVLFEVYSKTDTQISITVKTTFEALHSWESAPSEVSFLSFPHRHLFHVKLKLEAFGENREQEYFIVKRWLDWAIGRVIGEKGIYIFPFIYLSCEQIAMKIHEMAKGRYGNSNTVTPRAVEVTVSEDGENEATISDF